MTLEELNRLPAGEAEAALLACCGSQRWAAAMAGRRPFVALEEAQAAADEVWWGLAPADWLEAFAAHPRIGERPAGEGRSARWSAQEQAAAGAAEDLQEELARANALYERRFGHLFIVCANGRGAAEILALLAQRLDHDPAAELRVAAGEQAAITRLRLARLLEGS